MELPKSVYSVFNMHVLMFNLEWNSFLLDEDPKAYYSFSEVHTLLMRKECVYTRMFPLINTHVYTFNRHVLHALTSFYFDLISYKFLSQIFPSESNIWWLFRVSIVID